MEGQKKCSGQSPSTSHENGWRYNKPYQKAQTLKGIHAYERLRREWIAANPDHSEQELLSACITYAKICGLVLRQAIIQQQLDMSKEGVYGN
jgi:hypothetical protein